MPILYGKLFNIVWLEKTCIAKINNDAINEPEDNYLAFPTDVSSEAWQT